MNARDFALIQLDKKTLPGWKANLLREKKPSGLNDPRDLALADQIINGVVKNLLLLQHAIEHYSGKPLAGVDPLIQKILAIGLYQLKFLDRIPVSAAVDEAVEQTKRFGQRRASGFVNAVLRNVARQPEPQIPDANDNPEAYAWRVLSHPPELFRKLASLLGNERALAFCRHNNIEPPIIVRLFKGVDRAALMVEWEKLRDRWREKKLPELPAVELTAHEAPGLLVAHGARSAILAHWAKLGFAQAQDPTAAGIVQWMQIAPGQRVLDRCAGLGTKTMQILERVGDGGEVVAIDASGFRSFQLRQMLFQRGIKNVRVVEGEKLSALDAEISGKFDRILIDVPCSNSGVLARRPEARYRSAIDCLVKIQREILDDTFPSLADGGLLVYSTCSVWPEENELQIQDFMSRNPSLELVEQLSVWPSFDQTAPEKYHDGGYAAVLKKK